MNSPKAGEIKIRHGRNGTFNIVYSPVFRFARGYRDIRILYIFFFYFTALQTKIVSSFLNIRFFRGRMEILCVNFCRKVTRKLIALSYTLKSRRRIMASLEPRFAIVHECDTRRIFFRYRKPSLHHRTACAFTSKQFLKIIFLPKNIFELKLKLL